MKTYARIRDILTKRKPSSKKIFFLLSFLVGILTLWPFNDFQFMISTGDHGRDLYCFKKTMEGALPYRDYSWLFGPLMPYYYIIFYRLFGVSIQSVLLGQNILILLIGLVLYLCCTIFISPSLAFVCATWYWAYRGVEFFYTYNHAGALLFLVTALYFILKYIRKPKRKFVLLGSLSVLMILLIRVNLGVSTLAAFFTSLLIIDGVKKNPQRGKNRKIYLCLVLGLIFIVTLIYGYLLYPLPGYVLGQTFPFFKSYRTDTTTGVGGSLSMLWRTIIINCTKDFGRVIIALLLLLSLIQAIISFRKGQIDPSRRSDIILASSAIIFLMIVSLHEFIASGVHYRLLWIIPPFMILMFIIISTGTRMISNPWIKFLIFITLLILSLTNIYRERVLVQFLKSYPLNHLVCGASNVYVTSPVDWTQTVTRASRYIQDHTEDDEKIFALPFDPLYYFLTGRDGASRQLIFFDHKNITPEQERNVIADLEKHRVRYIILSNRAISSQEHLGVFGRTYCPLIYQYMQDHFKTEALFGSWNTKAGWGWNHAVKIYKRIDEPPNKCLNRASGQIPAGQTPAAEAPKDI